MEALEHGLRVKLDEFSVPPELQAYLAKIGFKTVALFQCIATSQEGVEKRALLFGLDPEKHVDDMILVSGLVGAWEDLSNSKKLSQRIGRRRKSQGR